MREDEAVFRAAAADARFELLCELLEAQAVADLETRSTEARSPDVRSALSYQREVRELMAEVRRVRSARDRRVEAERAQHADEMGPAR